MKTAQYIGIAFIIFLGLLGIGSSNQAQALIYGGVFSSPEEEETVRAAERAYEFRDYENAWTLAKDAVEQYPESLEAARLYLLIGQQMRRLSDVLLYFRDAEREKKISPVVGHYVRGWSAILLGDNRTARRELGRAMEIAEEPDFELERAWLLARRARPETSRSEILSETANLVQRYMDVPLAHFSYLRTLQVLEESKSAYRRALDRAYEAGAMSPEAWMGFVAREYDKFWSDPVEVLRIVDRALEEFPESTDLTLQKIDTLRRLGRNKEALELTRVWREKAPNHGRFRMSEIDLLTMLNQWDEAIDAAKDFYTITWQDDLVATHPVRHARILHEGNRRSEAIEVLEEFVRRPQTAMMNTGAEQLLSQLLTSSDEDRVVIMDPFASPTQRGNYCGPASVCMILSRWNLDKTQEQIAERVYTGIAGTPPQVISHYVRTLGFQTKEFTATEAQWKALIDAGYPILWLQMLGSRGAHYRVITGYDDVRNMWIMHDPNWVGRTYIPYDDIDDEWFLPQLQRSIVIFPNELENEPILQGLNTTSLLVVSNWILYTATGSNLFVGLFPALLVNLAGAALISYIIVTLLGAISFPRRRLRMNLLYASILLPIVVLNLLIGTMRLSNAVSLLLAMHLALITLIPILIFAYYCQRALNDFMHPRETVGIAATIVVVWACLSFVDQDPWQWLIPLVFFFVMMPWVLWPRLRIRRAETLSLRWEGNRALEILRPEGIGGRSYYTALCLQLECYLRTGRLEEFHQHAEALLADHDFPKRPAPTVEFTRLLAMTLKNDPDAHAAADAFLKRPDLSKALHQHAVALDLYHRVQRDQADETPQQIDAIMETIRRSPYAAFRPLMATRYRVPSLFAEVSSLLLHRAAIRHAKNKGDTVRAQSLTESLTTRHGWLAITLPESPVAS